MPNFPDGSAGRKARLTRGEQVSLVVAALGGAPLQELADGSGVSARRLRRWVDRVERAIEGAISPRRGSMESQLEKARERERSLAMDVELMRARFYSRDPFDLAEVRLIAQLVSPTTGQRYGLQRVCRVWMVPRSRFYAADKESRRRGRPPAVPDEMLDELVRKLVASQGRVPAHEARSSIQRSLGLPVALARVRACLTRVN